MRNSVRPRRPALAGPRGSTWDRCLQDVRGRSKAGGWRTGYLHGAALPKLVQIAELASGGNHVRKRVAGRPSAVQHLSIGLFGKEQFQDADRFAALADGDVHPHTVLVATEWIHCVSSVLCPRGFRRFPRARGPASAAWTARVPPALRMRCEGVHVLGGRRGLDRVEQGAEVPSRIGGCDGCATLLPQRGQLGHRSTRRSAAPCGGQRGEGQCPSAGALGQHEAAGPNGPV